MDLNELKLRLDELSVIVKRFYNIAPWTTNNRIVLLYNDGSTKSTTRGNIVIYVNENNSINFELADITYDISDVVMSRKCRAIAELVDIAGNGVTNKQRFIDTILEFANCHNINN